jgi:8-oxo-dGTP pyrophosphatase MutT (NUDIX family)
MKTFFCNNKCCNYKVTPYNLNIPFDSIKNKEEIKIKKSGSFIYDSESNKILLVQSRGQMWGCPKGSIKDLENTIDCAIREVKEETGIELDEKQLSESRYLIINSKALYYFVQMKENDVFIQNQIIDNDANGIGWFNIDCLEELVKDGVININQHSRILIKKALNKEISFNKSSKKRSINYLL